MRQRLKKERWHVLVIDDVAVHREIAKANLSNLGFQVNSSDGHDLEERTLLGVDIILLDLDLNGLRGEDLLAKIKQAHHKIPVVMVSGNKDQTRMSACGRLGAVKFVHKPVRYHDLAACIRRILERPIVLIVNEREATRNTLRDGFEKRDMTAIASAEANRAIELTHLMDPDFVIIDHPTAGIDVLDLLDLLRRHDHPPEIIITIESGEAAELEALRHRGAVDVFVKPVRFSEIANVVESNWKTILHRDKPEVIL